MGNYNKAGLSKCKLDDCFKPYFAKGYCNTHYYRFRRHGDPYKVIHTRTRKKTFEDRYWEKVDKTDTCWLWTAAANEKGYGQFAETYHMGQKRRTYLVHRLSYEWAKGEIPKGYQIVHTCENINCVNPDHLLAATHAETVRRTFANRKPRGQRAGQYKVGRKVNG